MILPPYSIHSDSASGRTVLPLHELSATCPTPAAGYEETSSAEPCEVCYPLGSGRWRTEFRRPRISRLLTAQKRTSSDYATDVWF